MAVRPLTAIVLTLDEADVIERCLAGLSFADEVLVLDSGSTDGTRARAEALGARVVEQPWLGYARQRNRGLELARNEWVLFVDADEIVTPELARSIAAALAAGPAPQDGFAVRRRGEFLGALMPSEPRRSKPLVRLCHRDHGRYPDEQLVHEALAVPGRVTMLDGDLLHWDGAGYASHAASVLRYAELEARELRRTGARASGPRIAVRPLLRFGWCYVVRGAWRQGTRGLIWSLLKATGELHRHSLVWEAETPPTPAPVPAPVHRPV